MCLHVYLATEAANGITGDMFGYQSGITEDEAMFAVLQAERIVAAAAEEPETLSPSSDDETYSQKDRKYDLSM